MFVHSQVLCGKKASAQSPTATAWCPVAAYANNSLQLERSRLHLCALSSSIVNRLRVTVLSRRPLITRVVAALSGTTVTVFSRCVWRAH